MDSGAVVSRPVMTVGTAIRAVLTVLVATLTISTVASSPPADASTKYKPQFNQQYGTNDTRLDNCRTCHGATNDEENINPYGIAWAANNYDFAAIEGFDSDGDGYTNIDEIRALAFPGDPGDVPTPLEPPTTTTTEPPSTTTTTTRPKTLLPPPPGPGWPFTNIPKLEDVLKSATDGLPFVGGSFGGEEGGFVPAPYADESGKFVEWATKGTTEGCSKCHMDKRKANHYLNVTPNGTADCWVCHSKHIICTVCHRIGAGESVGTVAAERVNAFTGIDASGVSDMVDQAILVLAPEVNYLVADGGLLLKDMPGDVSGIAGAVIPVLQGERPKNVEATIERIDNTAHDERLTARTGIAPPSAPEGSEAEANSVAPKAGGPAAGIPDVGGKVTPAKPSAPAPTKTPQAAKSQAPSDETAAPGPTGDPTAVPPSGAGDEAAAHRPGSALAQGSPAAAQLDPWPRSQAAESALGPPGREREESFPTTALALAVAGLLTTGLAARRYRTARRMAQG